MDCSICFEAITKQTGVATLSCDHSFHFRCIDNWFTQQIWNDTPQSCPCCRSEGAESGLDRCNIAEDNDDATEEEDDDYDDDETASVHRDDDWLADMLMSEDWILERNVVTGQFLFTSAAEVSMMRFRNLFGPLNDMDFEPTATRHLAARKIQTVYRAYKARTTFQVQKAARTLLKLFFEAYTPGGSSKNNLNTAHNEHVGGGVAEEPPRGAVV